MICHYEEHIRFIDEYFISGLKIYFFDRPKEKNDQI